MLGDYVRRLHEKHSARIMCRKIVRDLCAMGTVKRNGFIDDPDLHTSLSLLRSIMPTEGGTEAAELLRYILKSDKNPREEEIRIGDISAISHSKGRWIGNLCRLKYTPDLEDVAYRNPSQEIRQALWSQVKREFGRTRDGFFRVNREEWSGRLIASNSGAARRFCWVRHYDPARILKCRVTTWRVDREAMEIGHRKFWICIVPRDVVDQILQAARSVGLQGRITFLRFVCAIRKDNSSEIWCCCAVKRDEVVYPMLREALAAARVPLYDVSSWLMQLQAGRLTP